MPSYVHLFARPWFPDAMSFAAKSWREKLADRQGQRTVLKQVPIGAEKRDQGAMS